MNVGILRQIMELRDKFAPALEAARALEVRRRRRVKVAAVLILIVAGVIAASRSKHIMRA